MSDLRTAAQQALEALGSSLYPQPRQMAVIAALKTALAQERAEQAWVCPDSPEHRYAKPGHCEDCGKTLVLAQAEPVRCPASHVCDCQEAGQSCARAAPKPAQEQAEPAQEPGFWGRIAARQASRIKQLEAVTQKALEALGLWATGRDMDAVKLNDLIHGLEAALAQEQAEPAQVAGLREKVGLAYGYLWCVNNEPGAPHQMPPERMAYEARKLLRDTMTHHERGEFINRVVPLVRNVSAELTSAALAQKQAEPVTGLDMFLDPQDGLKPKRYKPKTEPAQEQAEPVVPQAEPLNLLDRAVQRRLAAQWGYVPQQAEPAQEPVAYTTGHCENHKQKGGCQLHNLQCGWPDCDRKPTTAPPQPPAEPAQEQATLDAAYQQWLQESHAPALRSTDSQGAFAAGWRTALAQEQAEPLTGLDIFLDPTDGLKPKRYKPKTKPAQAPEAWVASKDGRVIYDDASTDDGLLRVSGDFEDDEQRIRYAQRIVDALNAAYAAGAAAEREACAKLCDDYDDDRGTGETWGPRFAAIIRARTP